MLALMSMWALVVLFLLMLSLAAAGHDYKPDQLIENINKTSQQIYATVWQTFETREYNKTDRWSCRSESIYWGTIETSLMNKVNTSINQRKKKNPCLHQQTTRVYCWWGRLAAIGSTVRGRRPNPSGRRRVLLVIRPSASASVMVSGRGRPLVSRSMAAAPADTMAERPSTRKPAPLKPSVLFPL